MRDFKVSVSIIEPTFFSTGMTQTMALCKAMSDAHESLPQIIKDEYGREWLEAGFHNSFIVLLSTPILTVHFGLTTPLATHPTPKNPLHIYAF